MPVKVQLENGRIIEFEREPTGEDIDFAIEQTGGIEKPSLISPKYKPIYEPISVKERPFLGRVQEIAGQGGAEFLNQLVAGLGRPALRTYGMDIPEPQVLEGKIARGIGGVTGFVAGAPGRIATATTKGVGKILPQFIRPAIKKALSLGAGGAATGLVSLPETGEGTGIFKPKERAKQAALYGIKSAITPSVETGIGKAITAIPKTLKNASARIVNSLIKPLLKDFSYGKNPGLAIAEEGIIANNLDDLANKISIARQKKGQQIFDTLTQQKYQKIRLDITDSLKSIDEAMEKAASQNNSTLLNRLNEAKRALTQNLTIAYEQGQPVIKTLGDKTLKNLTPLEATKIKTEIGDLTKWTGNPSDDKLVNKALKQVYGSIKDKIGNAVPEVRKLNERYADLTSAEIATKYRDKIMARQSIVSLTDIETGLGSALLSSIASGGKTLPTVLAGVSAVVLKKIMSNPFFKTSLAKELNKLSESRISQILSKYPEFRRLIIKGVSKIQKF